MGEEFVFNFAGFLTLVQNVITSVVSWLGTALNFLTSNSWILIPTVFIPIAGMMFVYIRSTIRG